MYEKSQNESSNFNLKINLVQFFTRREYEYKICIIFNFPYNGRSWVILMNYLKAKEKLKFNTINIPID